MNLIKYFEDYTWVIGLSLIIVGATKIWSNELGILITGIIIYFISIAIKSLKEDEYEKILTKLDKIEKKLK